MNNIMNNKIKLIPAAFLLSFGAFAFASNYAGAVTPVAASSDVSASETAAALAGSPAQIYARNCARCHGANGKSDTELGKLNDAPDISTAHVKGKSTKSLTNIIKNGEGSMPGFGKKIAAKDISALVKYVRAL